MADLTTDDVWRVLGRQNFMVIAMVSARGKARSAGVMPMTHERRLWFTTQEREWKARHLAANPEVSVTVAIPKRVPLMPWIKVPAATITFSGVANVMPAAQMPGAVRDVLLKGLSFDDAHGGLLGVQVRPVGDFVTYGVGVSVLAMRDTEKARGRAPVGA